MSTNVNRRSFIAGAGMAAAAMATAGIAASAFADEEKTEDAAPTGEEGGDEGIHAPLMAEPKYASKDRNVCSDGTPVGTWRTKPEPINDATVAGEADVIVVGHGYAGITACREIAEEGHSVILLEKQYENMFQAMGNEAATVNASYMLEIGAPEIDINEYFTNWMMMAGWTVNPDLIMKFAQNSGANSDWYFDVCTHDEIASDTSVKYHYTGNFRFPDVDEGYYDNLITEIGGYHYYPTAFGMYGNVTQTMIHERNRQKAIDLGAQFFFNRSAEQLVQDESGAVTGVIVKNLETDEYEQYNGKAVIMATGGFGGNEDMCKDLLSDIETMLTDDELLSLCVIANRDGAGVRLPYWAGAKLEPQVATMGMRAGAPTQQPQGIWLNAEGKRCCNEFAPIREFVGNSLAFKPRDTYYCIYDANYANTWDHLCPGHSSITPNIAYKACLDDVLANAPDADGLYTAENGQFQVRISMYGAQTIEELFAKAGVTDQTVIDNAKASIERYNEMCASGVDSDYGRDAKTLWALDQGPYYMSTGTIGLGSALVTMGGIVTDGDQRALDANYKPIPGLYVSGNCCGRRFGYDYVTPTSGVSLGIAITLGRECGKSVCADLDA